MIKEVVGYTGYRIDSATGTITNKFGKPIKSAVHKGYLHIVLINSVGKRVKSRLHRLIALTFIPNPEDKPQVDHIDGDSLNNKIENLRWCTNQENQDFRAAQGNSGYGNHKVSKPIVWGEKVYHSIYALAKHIAGIRGSKLDTVKKQLKTVTKSGGQIMYGKRTCLVV
jgi:hypothetical protein